MGVKIHKQFSVIWRTIYLFEYGGDKFVNEFNGNLMYLMNKGIYQPFIVVKVFQVNETLIIELKTTNGWAGVSN